MFRTDWPASSRRLVALGLALVLLALPVEQPLLAFAFLLVALAVLVTAAVLAHRDARRDAP